MTKIHNKAQAPLTEDSTPIPLDLSAATDKAQLNSLKLNHVGIKIGTIPGMAEITLIIEKSIKFQLK